jgi:hypothetical protein
MTLGLNKRAYSSQALVNDIYQLANDEEGRKGRGKQWRKLQLKETTISFVLIARIAGIIQKRTQRNAFSPVKGL